MDSNSIRIFPTHNRTNISGFAEGTNLITEDSIASFLRKSVPLNNSRSYVLSNSFTADDNSTLDFVLYGYQFSVRANSIDTSPISESNIPNGTQTFVKFDVLEDEGIKKLVARIAVAMNSSSESWNYLAGGDLGENVSSSGSLNDSIYQLSMGSYPNEPFEIDTVIGVNLANPTSDSLDHYIITSIPLLENVNLTENNIVSEGNIPASSKLFSTSNSFGYVKANGKDMFGLSMENGVLNLNAITQLDNSTSSNNTVITANAVNDELKHVVRLDNSSACNISEQTISIPTSFNSTTSFNSITSFNFAIELKNNAPISGNNIFIGEDGTKFINIGVVTKEGESHAGMPAVSFNQQDNRIRINTPIVFNEPIVGEVTFGDDSVITINGPVKFNNSVTGLGLYNHYVTVELIDRNNTPVSYHYNIINQDSNSVNISLPTEIATYVRGNIPSKYIPVDPVDKKSFLLPNGISVNLSYFRGIERSGRLGIGWFSYPNDVSTNNTYQLSGVGDNNCKINRISDIAVEIY